MPLLSWAKAPVTPSKRVIARTLNFNFIIRLLNLPGISILDPGCVSVYTQLPSLDLAGSVCLFPSQAPPLPRRRRREGFFALRASHYGGRARAPKTAELDDFGKTPASFPLFPIGSPPPAPPPPAGGFFRAASLSLWRSVKVAEAGEP